MHNTITTEEKEGEDKSTDINDLYTIDRDYRIMKGNCQ